jgi:hypothetical protein
MLEILGTGCGYNQGLFSQQRRPAAPKATTHLRAAAGTGRCASGCRHRATVTIRRTQCFCLYRERFPPAILALADGTVFIGNSIGATGTTVGEVVFNTSITGYQEILTDPSYCQQIVTLTYPHIGNYGVNPEDIEADKVHAAGLIIKDLPLLASNFRQTETLSQYLVREGTVAIANIDTRKLTRMLRTQGAQNGAIVAWRPGTS